MANKSKNQDKTNKQPKTILPFHQRFNIEVQDKKAKQRFLNRVSNKVFKSDFYWWVFEEEEDKDEEEGVRLKDNIMWKLANALGKTFSFSNDWNYYISGDFHTCLQTLEIIYRELPKDDQKEALDEIIKEIISLSEVDLGMQWREGVFWPSGAKLLDEALVNEPLQWLSDPKYHNVLAPFKKGLSHFMEANKQPERLADTTTDMYEALEALAKVATSKPKKDLSGNAELFVKKLGLSDYYKKMLKDYISYANEFRHALEEGKERVPPSVQEVEAFIYTTGLFIRLAIERINTQKSVSP